MKSPTSDALPLPNGAISSSALVPKIISGSIGSIITNFVVTPLEVAKIRQQSSLAQAIASPRCSQKTSSTSRQFKAESCPRGCGGTVTSKHSSAGFGLPKSNASQTRIFSRLFESMPSYTMPSPSVPKSGGTFFTLRSIFHSEGVTGLYAGLRPTLIMSIPSTVLHLATYDEISSILRQYHVNCISTADGTSETLFGSKEDAKRQAYIPVIAGSTARLLSTLATAPLDLIRTRQASRVGREVASAHPGMLADLRFLVKTKGPSSLYTGLGATLWRDIPFAALYWTCLQHIRNKLSDSHDLGSWGGRYYLDHGIKIPSSIEFLHAFSSGAGAGAVAAMATTPFDVLKTRKQMVGASSANLNLGTFGCLEQIVHQEGVQGLWKGNQTRMLKLVPAYGIMISCYELGKRIFEDVLEN